MRSPCLHNVWYLEYSKGGKRGGKIKMKQAAEDIRLQRIPHSREEISDTHWMEETKRGVRKSYKDDKVLVLRNDNSKEKHRANIEIFYICTGYCES